jgi:D-hexose-6-phosphate mutarotase
MILPNGVTVEAGQGGLQKIVVQRPNASAEIYLQGATVTGFTPRGHAPVLFVSGQANFRSSSAIRGGVPICFPWFGPKTDNPAAPQHGYARTSLWQLETVHDEGDTVAAVLTLEPDATVRLRYTVRIGEKLELGLLVENREAVPLEFEAALHAYFSVADVREISIHGLERAGYIDKVLGGARKQEGATPIRIEGETDRVYLGVTGGVELADPVSSRRISIQVDGFRSLVVWNPWIAKAKALKDFGDDEWTRMVCLEPANVADDVVLLAAGQMHEMRALIVVNPGV